MGARLNKSMGFVIVASIIMLSSSVFSATPVMQVFINRDTLVKVSHLYMPTVRDLKNIVFQKFRHLYRNPEAVRFSPSYKYADPHKTLSQCGVENNDTIYLLPEL